MNRLVSRFLRVVDANKENVVSVRLNHIEEGKFHYLANELGEGEELFVLQDGNLYGRRGDSRDLCFPVDSVSAITKELDGYSLEYFDKEHNQGWIVVHVSEPMSVIECMFSKDERRIKIK